MSHPPGITAITVRRATGIKCPRCWRIVDSLDLRGCCDRCVDALPESVCIALYDYTRWPGADTRQQLDTVWQDTYGKVFNE